MAGGVEIKWYADTIMNDARIVIEGLEKETAHKVANKAKARCPVWDGEERAVTSGDKSWKSRKKGALRDSIRVARSKYRDGGYLVFAGNYDVYYASFVELGTKSWWAKGSHPRYKKKEWMRRPIPEDPFLRKPLEQERKRFIEKLKDIFR